MDGPWQNYAPAPASAPQVGPWTKYQAPSTNPLTQPAPAAPRGALASAVAPIAKVPRRIAQSFEQSSDLAHGGAGEVDRGFAEARRGQYLQAAKDVGLGYGKDILGAAGMLSAPISGAVDAIVGQPTGELTEGLTGSKTAGELARNTGDIAATMFLPTPEKVPAAAAPDEIADASARLGVPIPKAAATESIPVKSTAGALKEVPVVGAPIVKASRTALSGLNKAVNDTASGYGETSRFGAGDSAKQGVTDWITGKSNDIADRVYNKVDGLVRQNFKRPLFATRKVVKALNAEHAAAKLPPSKAVGLVEDAIQPKSWMTYDGIKNLRSRVGELADSGLLPEGMSKSDLKRVYGALSEDLRGHVSDAGGPKALAAFDKANGIYRQISQRRAALAKIVGTRGDVAPETVLTRIVRMASGKGGDLTKLSQARKAIGPEGWNDVAAAAIKEMGRASPDSEDFSGDRFVTAWNNLSPAGKQLLFNSTGRSDLAKSLEDIATLSKAHKSLMSFGNPSGTGRVGSLLGAAGAIWADPLAALGSAVGGNILARALASPVTAKAASKWVLAYSKTPSLSRVGMLTQASEGLAKALNSAFGSAFSGKGIVDLVKSYASHGQVNKAGVNGQPVPNKIEDRTGAGMSQLRTLAPHVDFASPKMRAPAAKWTEARDAYAKNESAQNFARLRMAARNLSHNLADAGVQVSPESLMQPTETSR